MSDTIQLVKQSASHLKNYVAENFGIKLKSGHAQQLVSAVFNFKSYQSLITTSELILYSTAAKNYPTIRSLPLSQERIVSRMLSIPEIDDKLLHVSDELAEEVLIGVLPLCLSCGTCEELRWPFTTLVDVYWCCQKCAERGDMGREVDKRLTEMYSKAKDRNNDILPVQKSVDIHKVNFMPEQVQSAILGDFKKWDWIVSQCCRMETSAEIFARTGSTSAIYGE